MEGVSSSNIVSEYSPHQVSSISEYMRAQMLSDAFSQEEVFSFMLQELNNKAECLLEIGKQYSQKYGSGKNASRLPSFSARNNEDYLEIVKKKGNFSNKLADAVDLSDFLFGVPKCRIQCYQELLRMVDDQCKEARQDVQQTKEQKKKIKLEYKQLSAQLNLFSNLIEGPSSEEVQQPNEEAVIFKEAKRDLDTVSSRLLPNDEEKSEFFSVMNDLAEAYIQNMENENNQYVEIQPSKVTNKGLRCLIQGLVIVVHPLNPRKFRLCIGE